MNARIALLAVFTVFCCRAVVAGQSHEHAYDPTEKLGTVSFPTSCAASVQKSFERGVALMHSFWYEEAEKQFAGVAANDPKCAMAYWGEAMSLWHQLWERPKDETLKRASGFVHQAQAAGAKTQRERDFIAAIAAFYRDYDKVEFPARATAYSNAMETVYRQYPKDQEAAAFYALSLLASAPPRDTTLAAEKKAIPILQKLFDEQPYHPGAAHYLIHSCDSPQLASLGLAAARRYAQIAPASPHAVHMPSHIFARLGLWQEDIDSNLASVAATKKASAMHMAGAAHDLHALDFLEYSYLQIGEDAKAKAIVDQLASMPQMDMGDMHGYLDMARASFPSTYLIEMRQWNDVVALQPTLASKPYNQATIYWAQAIGYGHLGDAANARKAVEQYDAMVEATKKTTEAYYAEYMDTDGDEARGWAAFAEGKPDDALQLIRKVADRQDSLGKRETALPAREMLADMLLQMDRPQEALAEYEKSLKTDPNRFNGLYGAARAAAAVNQPEKAKTYYARLLKNCNNGAHSDRPELTQAKTLIATKQ
jgi:tetratricopeptide (TPR) repeat protein